MNSLVKWWNLKRGKRLCHYCPDSWMNGFSVGGNCMWCNKCGTMYIHEWKNGHVVWPKKWTAGMGSIGDPDRILAIRMSFHRMRDGLRKECVFTLYPIADKTTIILDFGKDDYQRPTLELPYMMKNVTPSNVADKVKTIMLFS